MAFLELKYIEDTIFKVHTTVARDNQAPGIFVCLYKRISPLMNQSDHIGLDSRWKSGEQGKLIGVV